MSERENVEPGNRTCETCGATWTEVSPGARGCPDPTCGQEPEGDVLDTLHEAAYTASNDPTASAGMYAEVLEDAADEIARLRARVQPRTVSEEEVRAARNEVFGTDPPSVASTVRFLRRLGITITPTEEQDDGE